MSGQVFSMSKNIYWYGLDKTGEKDSFTIPVNVLVSTGGKLSNTHHKLNYVDTFFLTNLVETFVTSTKPHYICIQQPELVKVQNLSLLNSSFKNIRMLHQQQN